VVCVDYTHSQVVKNRKAYIWDKVPSYIKWGLNMSKARQLIQRALAAKDDEFFDGVYRFKRGNVFSPIPIDTADHLDLYSSIVQLLRPSRTPRKSIGATLLYLFLVSSQEFYGQGPKNYTTFGRRGRDQMKEQLEAYCSSISALEIVYHDNNTPDGANATVGKFDEHSTRHELEDLLDLVRTDEWREGRSYEIVYVQSPGDLVSEDGREDIVAGSLSQRFIEGLRVHEDYFATNDTFREEVPDEDYAHLFEGDVSHRETYELCDQYLVDHQELSDTTREHLEGFRARMLFMACSQEQDPKAEAFFDGLVAQVLPALPTEEFYINQLARNVAQTGGVLILEGFQQQEVEGFELLQEDRNVRLYTRVVEE